MSGRRDWLALIVSLVACLSAGAIGGLATASSVKSWYPTLVKPSWNPPDALFGPVWTTLYVMMAVAAWLVWRERGPRPGAVRAALSVFGAQLLLNTAWSLLFFGLQRPGAAAVEIVALWLAIAATIGLFARVSRVAAWLLAPYLAWVSFATVLNLTIWRLN